MCGFVFHYECVDYDFYLLIQCLMTNLIYSFVYQKYPDKINPLDGIFEFMLKKEDVIKTKAVIVYQSSSYPSNDLGDELKHAENLIYRKNESVWASINQLNEYFEIYFPRHIIELSNYTFMATARDDDIPRSWAVSCVEEEKEITLAEEFENPILCDGITGIGLDFQCKKYDKQIFSITNQKMCKRIRFKITGPNSSGYLYFVLSGIELFGKLFRIVSLSCQKIYHIKLSLLFIILNLN